VVLVVPLVVFGLLAAIFSSAVIRGLKVDVVDLDRTQTSMRIVESIGASPSLQIAERSSDLGGAVHAIRSGAAIAAVYIPPNFERDFLAGRRPQVVSFYNTQYLTPGNVASGAISSAVNAAAAELPRLSSVLPSYVPGQFVVEQYVLTNPGLNYVQFLLRAILPTVLHILIAIGAGYAVGSEFGSRSLREWMEAAGGSALTAIVGKLVPYLAIYATMMAVGLAIIHGFYQVPFRGDPAIVIVSAVLLIIAYMTLAALLQLLARNLAFGLTLTSIICSPAFGFVGIGFPVLAMNGFSQAWGALLPLRWYLEILFDQAARGVPVSDSAYTFAILGGLAVGFFLLAWIRLAAIAKQPVPSADEPPGFDATGRFGVIGAFAAEYCLALRDRGVFGMIIVGPLLYGILYPQPYIGELLRDVPIAVVDNDDTDLSRTIIQTLNDDQAISVAARPATLAEAKTALARRQVFGIVSIPEGTEREVLKGAHARLPAYVDSAYFLIYSQTLRGILEAIGTVGADVAARGARPDGGLYRAMLARSSPVEVLSQPLFNPTGGYASYVVPSAFVLILQQTLLMGAATAAGVANERGGAAARRRRGTPSAIFGQALAHLALALPSFGLYLVVLPRMYGFSASDRLLDLLAFAIPFILSVSFLGQFLGAWFSRRESALLLIIGLSLPMFFLVGVAWPLEAIPTVLRHAAIVIPSTAGIDGLVRIGQMGAPFEDVLRDWRSLWLLAAVYAGLAMAMTHLSGAGRPRL